MSVENKDNFVNLHVHSYYSLLDGTIRIKELVDRTLELGQFASTISDHGNLHAVIEHHEYGYKKGQHVITGMEAYVVGNAAEKNKSEAQSESDTKREHLMLWANNDEGYKNLMYLASESATKYFYYRPRIDDGLMLGRTKGLTMGTACLGSRSSQHIMKDRLEDAEKTLIHYQELFDGRVYAEIMPTNSDNQRKVNRELVKLARKLGIPLLATNDAHYLRKEDYEVHDALLAIQSRSLIHDPERWRFDADSYYIASRNEMHQMFTKFHPDLTQEDIKEALDNTVKLAQSCELKLNMKVHYLPKINPPSDESFESFRQRKLDKGIAKTPSDDYLEYICIKGLKKFGKTSQQYRDRLNYELGVIADMGFSDYFLILSDVCIWCREQDIAVGPARGSAGGSLVAYASAITTVDPLLHDLLFERFLNPTRKKLPDIDIDFCIKRRGEVIQYLIDKWGYDRVSKVATFGKLQAKAVIKDICKAMGIDFDEVNAFTTQLPSGAHVLTIEEIAQNALGKQFFGKYPKVLEYALRLEGLPRHVSQHAAGVIITPEPLVNYLPLQRAKDEEDPNVPPMYLTQFAKDEVSKAGAVKFDVLGLKNVTELQTLCKLVNERYNKNIVLEDIPFDDAKTWALVSRGETLGIFQSASDAFIAILRQIQPTNLEEYSAANALVRPGASVGLPQYLAGRRNPEKIKYIHPKAADWLKSTYGAVIYQEQIMGLISVFTGCTFGEADVWRRKFEDYGKDENGNVLMPDEDREAFIGGCLKNGYDKKFSDEFLKYILGNIGYGFNKSHSIAYTYISYWTAYFKANYPLEFFTEMMNGNLGELGLFMEEARRMGIEIFPPHVNHSRHGFAIEGNNIRAGLFAVNNVGSKAIESIVENAPYPSIDDFFARNNLRQVNKKVVTALFNVGAFDGMGIEIQDKDIPEEYRDNLKVENGMVYLSRPQLAVWYQKVIEVGTKKTVSWYEVSIDNIPGKYLEQYEEFLDPKNKNLMFVSEDMMMEMDLPIDIGTKTRRRPKKKNVDEEDAAMVGASTFRKALIAFKEDIYRVKSNYLEDYLQECSEMGFAFLEHPLSKHVNKINSFANAEDGEVITTAGIITDFIPKTTKTGKPMLWVVLKTPLETVRLTLWDNKMKEFQQILKRYNLVVTRGKKGFGSVTVETMKQLNY